MFRNTNAGDTVMIAKYGYDAKKTLATVDRTTKTQIVVNGFRFRKETGSMVGGDGWNNASLYIPTEKECAEHRLALKKAKTIRLIKNSEFDKVGLEILEEVLHLIKTGGKSV